MPKLNAAFWKWFGGSVVRNDDRSPLIVYHGTTKQFDVFAPSKHGHLGFHFGTYDQATKALKNKKAELGSKDGFVVVAFLSIQNPLRSTDAGDWSNSYQTWVTLDKALDGAFGPYDFRLNSIPQEKRMRIIQQRVMDAGYDGIVYRNRIEGKGDSWVAFHSNQIKSIDNDGTWDVGDPNIRSNPLPWLALKKIVTPMLKAYEFLPEHREPARNPFLARPTKHYGSGTVGVATHPGFHTGSSMGVCQPYAQAKVEEFVPDSWGKELQTHTMRDYPVIIELDMQGLPFTIDYDAANWFGDAVKRAIEESEDFDALDSHFDFGDSEEEMPSSMIEALFYLSGAQPHRAVYNLRDWLLQQQDPYESFAKIKKEGLPDELLAHVSGQFRYTQDVPSGRVVTVHYIRPVFNYLFPHYDDPDWHHDKIIDRIEAAGYDVVTLENVYDNSEVLNVVKSIDVSQKLFPAENQRIEFHGTSLRNLLSAAPELKDILPLPPKPFWRYDPNEEKSPDAQA